MTYQIVLTALADPTRRSILESLRDQPRTVSELSTNQSKNITTVSRPAISQHLKVLKSAGLVSVQASGTRRIYAVKRDGLDELRRYLDTFWSDVLSAYGAEIEKRIGEKDA